MQYAYTPPGSNYPPYVNVTVNDDGTVRVMVRSEVKPDGSCGDTSSITLSKADFLSVFGPVCETRTSF